MLEVNKVSEGFAYLVLPDFVECFGLNYFEISMSALQEYFIKEASINTKEPVVNIGEDCLLSYSLRIETRESIHIRIEYAIDFVKSGNRNSRKIFLFTDKTLIGEQTLTGIKLHSFKDMTTRKHYIGNHKIVLLVNGKEIVETSIILQ